MGYESFALVMQSSVPPVNFEICQKAFNKLNSIGTLARMLLATRYWLLFSAFRVGPFWLHGWQANKHGTWQATGLHFTFHLSWVSQKSAHTTHSYTHTQRECVVERQGPGLWAQTGRTEVIIKLVIIKAATQSEVLGRSRTEHGSGDCLDWGVCRLKTGETTAAPIKFSSAVF